MNLQFPMTTSEIPENPKITLNLRGLGVLCFSEENNRAEIGYLDVPEMHDVQFGMVDSDDKAIIPFQSMRGQTLEIVTDGKGMGKVFNQSGSNKNFDLMLDLSEIYGDEAELKTDAVYQSRVHIDDAVFFTDPGNINKVVPFRMDSPNIKKRPMDIGEWLVAHTTRDDVRVFLDGEEKLLEGGKNYTISILSGCRQVTAAAPIESDFKFFFGILDNAGDVQFNLERAEEAKMSFTNLEKRNIFNVEEQFKRLFIENGGNGDATEGEKRDIFGKLQFFSAMFCPPQPCVKVTFANRPRNL